jgi:hypothetical protein
MSGAPRSEGRLSAARRVRAASVAEVSERRGGWKGLRCAHGASRRRCSATAAPTSHRSAPSRAGRARMAGIRGHPTQTLCIQGRCGHVVAREIQRPGGLDRLLSGRAEEDGPEARRTLALLTDARAALAQHRVVVEDTIASAEADGYRLTTVLDDDYPSNLRIIDNLPPFLFYQGELHPDDAYSVACSGDALSEPGGHRPGAEDGQGVAGTRAVSRHRGTGPPLPGAAGALPSLWTCKTPQGCAPDRGAHALRDAAPAQPALAPLPLPAAGDADLQPAGGCGTRADPPGAALPRGEVRRPGLLRPEHESAR